MSWQIVDGRDQLKRGQHDLQVLDPWMCSNMNMPLQSMALAQSRGLCVNIKCARPHVAKFDAIYLKPSHEPYGQMLPGHADSGLGWQPPVEACDPRSCLAGSI